MCSAAIGGERCDVHQVRARAAEILAKHCGSCHDGARATAKPGALAVFDLTKPEWWAKLDERRLESAQSRLEGKDSTLDERADFARFAAEEAARAGR